MCLLKLILNQGNYVGVAIMCKHFVLTVNTLRKETEEVVYRSGTIPKTLAEDNLIHEDLRC